MFYALATMMDSEIWQGILDQIPEGRDLILSHKTDIDLVHFSWIVSHEIELENLKNSIHKISDAWYEFETVDGGFGIFPGKEPVLTLVLARSKMMCELQSEMWQKCSPFLRDINQNYAPDAWIPHITLMHHDVHSEEYCSFLECCIEKEIHFRMKINNIALIYKNGKDSGELCRFGLKKKEHSDGLDS